MVILFTLLLWCGEVVQPAEERAAEASSSSGDLNGFSSASSGGHCIVDLTGADTARRGGSSSF